LRTSRRLCPRWPAARSNTATEYVDVPDAAARDGLVQAGLSEWMAEQTGALWAELRRRAMGATTEVIRILTGREPRTVADFTRDHAAAFR
jgi:hypothetical protein